MKTKNIFWFYPLVVIGLVIILTNSCKKNDDNNNPSGSITDKDGNVYTSVTIGTQVWMVENLKTTKYNNGDLIGTTTPASLDITNETTSKYQWAAGGDESNVAAYGRLYTWYTIADNRKVCPTGWHVSTESEWGILIDYLGNEVAGSKLKEAGSEHWGNLNTDATNQSGFKALPGGSRGYNGFGFLGFSGFWWTSDEGATEYSTAHVMSSSSIDAYGTSYGKKIGFSVRCVKD